MGEPLAVAAPVGSSELLERAGELASLGACLAELQRSSQGNVVLVSGEAGAGKTSLVRRFAEDIADSVQVLWGTCDSLFTPRPFGPLLAVAGVIGGELEEILKAGTMPHEVATALSRELSERGASVFVLEDIHWADEATLDVLMLLARRAGAIPALLIATYRDDELDRAHPLRRLLGEFATSKAVRRLGLAPLSPDAVAQLAGPHGVDGDDLYRRTAGNPFFVVEALAAGAGEIPVTVRDAVLARAAPLGPEARAVQDAAAVVPPRAELWLLEAMIGEALGGLDECVASGMLISGRDGVSFRHELARLAVEGSIGLGQKLALHRKALAALSDPAGGIIDPARLAHHAEEAGDADAVLRYAPVAAERAASTGAHREAAAQYARVLRFGGELGLAERADLYERRSHECYLTDQSDEAIRAIEEAIECRRELGDRLAEGDSLRWLSEVLWCPGRSVESEGRAREAVALLEPLPPGRELAAAYLNLARTCANAEHLEEAIRWATRALELARRLGHSEVVLQASGMIAICRNDESGLQQLEEDLESALASGSYELAGLFYAYLTGMAVDLRQLGSAARHLDAGLAYCSERGLELFRFYLLAFRARSELDAGRWSQAADFATSVLRIPRSSTTPRIIALVVLALVRARRGDPGHRALLDEAWGLAEPTGELPRTGPVASARAEVAWLEGNRDLVASASEATLSRAMELKVGRVIGELGRWRRLAGLCNEGPPGATGPDALHLAGRWREASQLWTEIGCPYEAALALGEADEVAALRRALEELQRLEARPAAAVVACRLRERGVRALPRGPRPATRRNLGGLTTRELEVLGLVSEGLRNAQIAQRLVLSVRTVDHHVEAIGRKLGVKGRSAMGEEALKLGLVRAPHRDVLRDAGP